MPAGARGSLAYPSPQKNNPNSGRKPKLGSGARFEALKRELSKRPGVTDPSGLAAAIGRKKFGKERFQRLAAKGR